MRMVWCFLSDHEHEAVWPAPEALHHHERRGGAGLRRNSQASSVWAPVASRCSSVFLVSGRLWCNFARWCLELVVVFLCLCLSPVSCQWFYPMVGYVMLFYHRVEPRTGCLEVSASTKPPHPQSSFAPKASVQTPLGSKVRAWVLLYCLWFNVCVCAVVIFITLCCTCTVFTYKISWNFTFGSVFLSGNFFNSYIVDVSTVHQIVSFVFHF